MRKSRTLLAAAAALALAGSTSWGAALSKGAPDLKSAGPIAFGPEGVLFLADTQGAALFAIDTGDRQPDSAGSAIKVDGIDEKIAGLLGTTAKKITINDLAVNPASGKAYLSVSRGTGPEASPVLVRVDRAGKVEVVSLENIPFAKAEIPNPSTATGPRTSRSDVITDVAFVDGRVFVAGLSNEEFSSRLLAVPYPFAEKGTGSTVEIYHGAHGRLETKSPVRTFTPYSVNGESYLLAAYTCTPLVKIPVASLKDGKHIKGTTVAELGNRNKPLDLIVYKKDGKDYLLLANSARGVMKINPDNVDKAEGINRPVKDKEGLSYDTLSELKGVTQLDSLDKEHALILVQTPTGSSNLETIALP
ncbi:hypothetical protein [Singulisphaera sp. PoT]|uniref:hypothetical protein n=1 Tax=Singulisphaera sp. PoT TaxID=3411797 RepID=UPI003BF4AB9C